MKEIWMNENEVSKVDYFDLVQSKKNKSDTNAKKIEYTKKKTNKLNEEETIQKKKLNEIQQVINLNLTRIYDASKYNIKLFENQKKEFENLNICFDISSLNIPSIPLSFKGLNKVNNEINFEINRDYKKKEFFEIEEYYKKKIQELTNIIETSSDKVKEKEQNEEFEENEEEYESENKTTKISIKTVKKRRSKKNIIEEFEINNNQMMILGKPKTWKDLKNIEQETIEIDGEIKNKRKWKEVFVQDFLEQFEFLAKKKRRI
jgi:hypothetical protein